MATSGSVASTDLAGKHAEPVAHHHVLLAIGDEEIALLVGTRDVTRVQPAVLQCLHGLFARINDEHLGYQSSTSRVASLQEGKKAASMHASLKLVRASWTT